MEKIDYRKHYVLVVDTETTNTVKKGNKLDMSNTLVYDIGWQVVDTKGNIYIQRSFLVREIFVHERELMRTAYYADKLSQYQKDIQSGTRVIDSCYAIHNTMIEDINRYRVKEVVAHNARFDVNALNNTQRFITKSKFRYWFPYDIVIWDTLRMSESVICKMPTYRKFCEANNLLTKTGRLSKTAENLWRFISKNLEFKESHTGLEDVIIETQIMLYCFKQHKKIKKEAFPNRQKIEPPTDFQRILHVNLKEIPKLRVGV